MALYEKFGEMDSAEEINELAMNLHEEGDNDSIIVLAEENGIPKDYADFVIQGESPYLCDHSTAAIGKIEVETKDLKPSGIMVDWVEYIKAVCMEDGKMAENVRRKVRVSKDASASSSNMRLITRRKWTRTLSRQRASKPAK